jgi:hypothetical protein
LLPLTAVVILALLPRITIGSDRLSLGWHQHRRGVRRHVGGNAGAVRRRLLGVDDDARGRFRDPPLLCRLWRHDFLLVLALSVLGVVRVCAFYDDLADPLAWTLIGVACLAWALTEWRPVVRAGFLTMAGLFALFAAAQWLTFAQVPRPFHGLVIVAFGSLGLMASQRLRATATEVVSTRVVIERLSVTWAVVGLAMAGGPPSHRAVELTVAGVATGIHGIPVAGPGVVPAGSAVCC